MSNYQRFTFMAFSLCSSISTLALAGVNTVVVTVDQPPRRMWRQDADLFEPALEYQGPPRKRWGAQDNDEVEDDGERNNAPEEQAGQRRERDDSNEDEVYNGVESKSRRTSIEDDVEVATTAYIANIMSRAQGGDLEAAYILAKAYLYGRQGLTKDIGMGIALLTDAALNGYARAQFFLGRAYENGWYDLVQDDQEAEQWYQKAATSRRGLKKARESLARLKAKVRAQQAAPSPLVWQIAPRTDPAILVLLLVRTRDKAQDDL